MSIKDIKDKKIIEKISFLKKQYWNYPIKELNNWFRKNINKKDINNLMFCSNKLVGSPHFVESIGKKPAILLVGVASAVGIPTAINK